MSTPPQRFVFISYAWESDAFRTQVKALCAYLRANGVTVVIDFDHALKPPDVGWPVWMQQSIEDAAVVLVVCSASYKPRFEKRAPTTSGKGVAWEGAVITQDLYNAAQRNNKFYPIFPDPFNFDHCPKALEPWSNGHAFPSKQADVLALVHACLGVPVAPAVGLAGALAANPFNPWHHAAVPYFFGRNDLLRCMQNALDEKRSISLVGDRLIGKTSILQFWKRRVEEMGYIARLLCHTGPEAFSCSMFIRAITGVEINSDDPENASNALLEWVEERNHLPPVILIDEADEMLLKLPYRFFERLRGLIAQKKICLVLASLQHLEHNYQGNNQSSPFLNLLEMRRIGLLEPEDAEKIITLGGTLFNGQHCSLMRRWAGCHPYFLALFGRYLWDAYQNGLDINLMLEQINDVAAIQLTEIWRHLSERDRSALFMVLDGKPGVVANLRLRGLVTADPQRYELFGEVLAQWLMNHR